MMANREHRARCSVPLLTAIMGTGVLLSAATIPVTGKISAAWPIILCSDAVPDDAATRPKSVVTTLRSESLSGMPGKRVTVQLVRFPPRGFTPAHVHGGDVTAYVLEGKIRSEHAGLPAADYDVGQTIHEPLGTTHFFIENPSFDRPAAILAITVHDDGAPLTTFIR